MLYLYGKNIQNLRWEFIGEFTKEDADKYMKMNEDKYVSFQTTSFELWGLDN